MATNSELKSPITESKNQTIKNSAIVSFFNGLGFVSALLVDIIVASRFGISIETDAFFIAYTIPQFIASTITVAFSVVLVPIFTKVLVEDGHSKLWRITSILINLSLVVFLLLSLLGILGGSFIIRLQGAGLDNKTAELAVSLNMILFLMVIPLGGIEVMSSCLNALRDFSFPASSMLIQNGITFLLVYIFRNSFGIYAVAIGYTLAAWIRMLFLFIILFKKGFNYQRSLDLKNPVVRDAIQKMKYPFMGALIGQSNLIVERFLASFLPTGGVSALGYARRLLRAVDHILLGGVSTAFLPRLSAQASPKETMEFNRSLALATKLAVFISFPSSAIIVGLSVLVVTLLFGRGAFSNEAVSITSILTSIYILGIPAEALFRVLRVSFYAHGNTKTPFNIRLFILIINIVLDFSFFYFLDALGLALALSLARTIGLIFTIVIVQRQYKLFKQDVILFTLKIGLASTIMSVGLYIYQYELLSKFAYLIGDKFQVFFGVTGGIVLGAFVFVITIFGLRLDEFNNVVRIVIRKIQKSI